MHQFMVEWALFHLSVVVLTNVVIDCILYAKFIVIISHFVFVVKFRGI